MSFTQHHLSFALGSEIKGLNLSQAIDQSTIQTLRKTLAERGFLLFRNQDITPEQHIAFTKQFGELQPHSLDHYLHPEYPEIFVVTNRHQNGKPSETRNTGREWHMDLTYTKTPCMGSLLHCKEIPSVGGDTLFASLYKAYDELSDGMKEILGKLSAIHDFANVSDLKNRTPESVRHLVEKNPPVTHSLVKEHPETGRKVLFFSDAVTSQIEGFTEEESQPILDFLAKHTTRVEFTYRHQWQVNDLVFWDNRCVIHMAPPDYDRNNPTEKRHMFRTTLKQSIA